MERGKRNKVPGSVGSRMVVINAGGAEITRKPEVRSGESAREVEQEMFKYHFY